MADFFPFDMNVLGRTATRIINGVRGINRVVSDVTSKPPGTIEWEYANWRRSLHRDDPSVGSRSLASCHGVPLVSGNGHLDGCTAALAVESLDAGQSALEAALAMPVQEAGMWAIDRANGFQDAPAVVDHGTHCIGVIDLP
jgi:hypothetical protein